MAFLDLKPLLPEGTVETREIKLATLQAALIEGEQSKFTEGFDLDTLNAELNEEMK